MIYVLIGWVVLSIPVGLMIYSLLVAASVDEERKIDS